MESQLGLIEQSLNNRYSNYAHEALDELPGNFTITDPSIPGHPIVFASRGFLKMSGYFKDEVIGKNGRIFQGPRTCRRSVMEIRDAIREERTIQINLLNYRRDGTPFWMLFHMSPVFSEDDGRVIHFVAVQVPLSRKRSSSGCGFRRNGVNLSENGPKVQEFVFGSCRKEVCSDSFLKLSCDVSPGQALDHDVRESESEELCEASDLEKRRAMTTMDSIFSVLTNYSQSTGRLVSRKRSSKPEVGHLSSSLNISLGRIKQSFVLTSAHLPDMPIVYASDAFLELTGYARDEVLGRNCRFLSGMNTDTSTLYHIRESIKAEQPCTVRILNYRKDKSSFWNLLHISPVRDSSGKLVASEDDDLPPVTKGLITLNKAKFFCHSLAVLYPLPCLIVQVAYFVGVQIEEESSKTQEGQGLGPEMRQRSVVGAVKVAVRSSSMTAGCCSKS